MKKIFVALCMVAFLAACDDSSSASAGANDESGGESSSSVVLGSSSSEKEKSQSSSSEKSGKSSCSVIDVSSSSVKSESTEKSSSSEKLSVTSSSSAGKIESSSSKSDVPQSYAEAKVMPSGTYDCTKYKCVTMEYLNQEFLEAGKYGEILDERDNQVYKTVQIGEQIWMAENLNYETYRSWCGGGIGYVEGNCATYGRLYTWAAAMDRSEGDCGYSHDCTTLGWGNVQGVCPNGWHVPSEDEWDALIAVVGGRDIAGQKLKAQTGWNAYSGIINEDAVGFSALPAGFSNNGHLNDVGDDVFFWSATQSSCHSAYDVDLYYNYDGVYLKFGNLNLSMKYYGHSVRCVRD